MKYYLKKIYDGNNSLGPKFTENIANIGGRFDMSMPTLSANAFPAMWLPSTPKKMRRCVNKYLPTGKNVWKNWKKCLEYS